MLARVGVIWGGGDADLGGREGGDRGREKEDGGGEREREREREPEVGWRGDKERDGEKA